MRKFSFNLVNYEVQVTHSPTQYYSLEVVLTFKPTKEIVKSFNCSSVTNSCYLIHQEILCYQENKCDPAALFFSVESMRDTLTHYFDQLEWKELCPNIELLGEVG